MERAPHAQAPDTDPGSPEPDGLRIESLTRTLRHAGPRRTDRLLLQQVSASVGPGEWGVVVGPSGAGKTTLLRVVAGLEPAQEGRVVLQGKDLAGVSPAARGLSFLFQDPPLFPHLNVEENLRLGMRRVGRVGDSRGTGDPDGRELAERLGLGTLLRRSPSELSGGERQRVALAGAMLSAAPGARLWDEPLAQLDGPLRLDMRRELRRLRESEEVPWLQVTHDQAEAMAVADRLFVMKAGVIEQAGRPMDLYRRPANVFVAGFLGSPGMQVVSGRIERSPSGAAFRLPGPEGAAIRCGNLPTPPEGECRLGVRPEGWRLSRPTSDSPTPAEAARARIESVEPLGHETLVGVRIGHTRWWVRAGPEWAEAPRAQGWVGGEVVLEWTGSGVAWFDAGTGVRLEVQG